MVAADATVGGLLELPVQTGVYQIRRARRIDGRLVLYVEHYLNPVYFPDILRFNLTHSLTDLYANEYGIRYGRVRFEMRPTALRSEAALALKVSMGSPALHITRVNRDQLGRLIDCDLEYWRHDAIHVSVDVPE
jgi:DNA-binding GntR family transcriptional regulator